MLFKPVLSLALASTGVSVIFATAAAATKTEGGSSHPDISGHWVAQPHTVHAFFPENNEDIMFHNSSSSLYLQQDGCHLWGNRSWVDTNFSEGHESLVGSFLGGDEDDIRILSIEGSESNDVIFKEASVRYDGTTLHYAVVAYSHAGVGVSYTAAFEREETR